MDDPRPVEPDSQALHRKTTHVSPLVVRPQDSADAPERAYAIEDPVEYSIGGTVRCFRRRTDGRMFHTTARVFPGNNGPDDRMPSPDLELQDDDRPNDRHRVTLNELEHGYDEGRSRTSRVTHMRVQRPADDPDGDASWAVLMRQAVRLDPDVILFAVHKPPPKPSAAC